MHNEYLLALQQAEDDIATFVPSVSAEETSSSGIARTAEGLWAYNVKNNRVYWSNQLFDMLGMLTQKAPLTIEIVRTLIHPEDQQGFAKLIQASLTFGEPFEAEFRMQHSSGEYLTVQLAGKGYLDSEREPSRISGQMVQLTELQQAERSLRKVHKELADIRHALNESTVLSITDQAGVITYINDALCRISQYSRDELIGETLQIINSNYHPKAFFQEMWNVIGSGHVWRDEIKHQAKDGTYFWMDTTVVPLLDASGTPFQYIVVTETHSRYRSKLEFQDGSTTEWIQSKKTLKLSSSRSKKRCRKAV